LLLELVLKKVQVIATFPISPNEAVALRSLRFFDKAGPFASSHMFLLKLMEINHVLNAARSFVLIHVYLVIFSQQ